MDNKLPSISESQLKQQLPSEHFQAILKISDPVLKQIVDARFSGRKLIHLHQSNKEVCIAAMALMIKDAVVKMGYLDAASDNKVLERVATDFMQYVPRKFSHRTIEEFQVMLDMIVEGKHKRKDEINTINCSRLVWVSDKYDDDEQVEEALDTYRKFVIECQPKPTPPTEQEIENVLCYGASKAWGHFKETGQVNEMAIHCYDWMKKKIGFSITKKGYEEIKATAKDKCLKEVKEQQEGFKINSLVARQMRKDIEGGKSKKFLNECKRETLRRLFQKAVDSKRELFE
jgi:hypothetical protein